MMAKPTDSNLASETAHGLALKTALTTEPMMVPKKALTMELTMVTYLVSSMEPTKAQSSVVMMAEDSE